MESELRHEINIYWSDGDGVFVAEAPELGCIAEGWSYESALLNLKIKIANFMEALHMAGKSLPEPRPRKRPER